MKTHLETVFITIRCSLCNRIIDKRTKEILTTERGNFFEEESGLCEDCQAELNPVITKDND